MENQRLNENQQNIETLFLATVSNKQKKVQNTRLTGFVSEFIQPKNEPNIVIDDVCYFSINDTEW